MSQIHILDTSQPTFSSLFRRYKLNSGFITLAELADALTDEGLVTDLSVLSRWQTGERIPSREYLLTTIKVFLRRKAINNLPRANELLEAAGYGFLTDSEQHLFFTAKVDQKSNLCLVDQFDGSILFDSPTIIDSLRKQGKVMEAQKTASFFLHILQQDKFLLMKTRNNIAIKLHTLWARTLSDYAHDAKSLKLFRKLSQTALEMSEDAKNRELILANIHNLAANHYVLGRWQVSKDFLLPNALKSKNPQLKAEMMIILLIDLAQLGEEQAFNYWRQAAEKLADQIIAAEPYHGESLYEAISRGLAILGYLKESRQVSQQIKSDKIRPFFESQMIKHPLITYLEEAKRGKLIGPYYIRDLLEQAKKPHLQVFQRHQYQIKELVNDICKLQPQVRKGLNEFI